MNCDENYGFLDEVKHNLLLLLFFKSSKKNFENIISNCDENYGFVDELRWQGNLQELKMGILIATHVDGHDLGYQFGIGKVLDVMMH